MIHRKYLLSLGILSLPLLYPLMGNGLLLTHDQYFPVHRLAAMLGCLSEGQIPPRWTDIFALGYGYPFFNFYAPLAYYLSALVFLLTQNYVISVHALFGLGLIWGGFGVYFWIQELFDKKTALVSAVIYNYLPYHLVNAYVRGDISELLASAFFPWVLWGLHRVYSSKDKYVFWMGISAIAYACILLSHNIMALLFTGYLIFYSLFLSFLYKRWLPLIYSTISIFLGLSISAYFWLPAFIEKKFVQVDSLLKAADYKEHFVYLYQLIHPYWGKGGSIAGPADQMSFQVGLVPIFLVVISLILIISRLIRKYNNPTINYFLIYHWLSLLVMIFLMLSSSVWIWEHVPLLHYTLFPWRILSLIGIPLAFICAFTIAGLCELNRNMNFQKIVYTVFIVLPIIVIVPYLQNQHIPISSQVIQKRFIWGVESVSKTYGTTMSNEYLPQWVKNMPAQPDPVFIRDVNGKPVNFSPMIYTSVRQKYEIHLEEDTQIIFALFYFPGWSVKVNGTLLDLNITPNGFISVKLPKGIHQVELIFMNTPLRKWANRMTISSLILMVGLLIYGIKGRLKGS